MKTTILDWNNKSCGTALLPEWLEDSDAIRYDVMHRVILWQRANARTGSRAVKTRSMVAATGKKPFRQKGTGRARQGSTVAPHMRGGGVCFGPSAEIRHGFSLTKRIRRMGLRSALALRLAQKNLFVIKNEDYPSEKTKDLRHSVQKNDWSSALFVSLDKSCENFSRACANIKNVDVMPALGLNVQDVLKHDKIFIFENALESVVAKVRY
ncbi:MAG: 50S ribosomal protein L4 [Alphaproteobacteria bacterium]|nr:50S ribosomal protein L4 [Alphaproteobacteria bacterium]